MSVKATLKILIDMIKRNLLLSVLLVCMSFIAIYMIDESISNYLYEMQIIDNYTNTYAEKTECVNRITYQSTNEDKTKEYHDFLERIKEVDKIKYYGRFSTNNFIPENINLPEKIKSDEIIPIVITEKSTLDLGNFYLSQEEKNILKNGDKDVYPVFIGSDMKDYISVGDCFTLKNKSGKFVVAGVLKKEAHCASRYDIGAYSDTLMDNKMLVCVDDYEGFIQDTSPAYIYYVCDAKDNYEVSNQLRKLARACNYDIRIENVQESIQDWKASYGMSDNKRLTASIMLMILAIISVTTVITAMCMMKMREYGIMYTVGVTFSDIKKLIILYDTLIVLLGSVWAWVLKNYDINRMYPKKEGTVRFFRDIWMTTHNIMIPIIILLCGCVIIFAASFVPLKIMKQKTPAEMIKKGE